MSMANVSSKSTNFQLSSFELKSPSDGNMGAMCYANNGGKKC